MNRPTTGSRMRMKDIWEQVMTMGASSGIFQTSWGHPLLGRQEVRRQWRLVVIAAGLLVYLLNAAPATSNPVQEDLQGVKVKTAAESTICQYPKVDSQQRGRTELNGHHFWLHRATVTRGDAGKAVFVAGQISHILNNRSDDQIYYGIPFDQDGRPKEPEIEIDRGGVAQWLEYVTAPFEIVGIDKIKLFGVEIKLSPEKLPEVWSELARSLEGYGWETQAAALVYAVAVVATNSDYCYKESFYWTEHTSEERAPLLCDWDRGTTGFACYGSYCDDVNLACAPVPSGIQLDYSTSTNFDSDPFSEEGASEGKNIRYCTGEGVVTGIRCTGKYCDKIGLECTQPASGRRTNCEWSESLSEEQGAYRFSHFIAGVECKGSYCDNKRFYVCSLEP